MHHNVNVNTVSALSFSNIFHSPLNLRLPIPRQLHRVDRCDATRAADMRDSAGRESLTSRRPAATLKVPHAGPVLSFGPYSTGEYDEIDRRIKRDTKLKMLMEEYYPILTKRQHHCHAVMRGASLVA